MAMASRVALAVMPLWLRTRRAASRFGDLYIPPIRRRQFYAVQAMVILTAALDIYLDVNPGGFAPALGALFFVPETLFLIPVVFAALNFGVFLAVATAVLCIILTSPIWLLWHTDVERWGVIVQMGVVLAVAVFVGMRVDREMKARRQAEAARAALEISDERYRGLFETAGEAIFVLDSHGVVQEANAAAAGLFFLPRANLAGVHLERLVGAETAALLLGLPRTSTAGDADVALRLGDGRDVWVEPVVTSFGNSDTGNLRQLLLRNVTEQRQRREGIRSYATEMLRAQEEERRRLAQELHDETVQELVQLARQIDMVETLDRALPPDVLNGLSEARAMVQDIVGHLRNFARSLRPYVLDDLGLVPALRRLTSELADRSDCAATLEVLGSERRQRNDMELGLFRIAQEALRNVERHANARHAVVTLSYLEQGLLLVVEDDGCGFTLPPTTNDLAINGKLGVLGMEERTRSIGGLLTLGSAPGRGTRLSVTVSHPGPQSCVSLPRE
ncbi:MAG: histidine kinase [Dehalococcoidia bacterium]|nr:histidine kinase [Dehalococcoidia bacterium]